MKHSKAKTNTLPVFVKNTGLHKLTPISEDTELSKICGGCINIVEFKIKHLFFPFVGLTGYLPGDGWCPAALITSIPLVTALIALPAYNSHKVTKKKYNKKLKQQDALIDSYIKNS